MTSAFQHGRVRWFDLFGGPWSHQQWPEDDRRLCTPTSSSQLCCLVCIVAEQAARDSATDLLPHITWLACRVWHRQFVVNTVLLIRQSTSVAWAQNTANMTTKWRKTNNIHQRRLDDGWDGIVYISIDSSKLTRQSTWTRTYSEYNWEQITINRATDVWCVMDPSSIHASPYFWIAKPPRKAHRSIVRTCNIRTDGVVIIFSVHIIPQLMESKQNTYEESKYLCPARSSKIKWPSSVNKYIQNHGVNSP